MGEDPKPFVDPNNPRAERIKRKLARIWQERDALKKRVSELEAEVEHLKRENLRGRA